MKLEEFQELFVKREVLQVRANFRHALSVTLVASMIAWFGLFLSEAVARDEKAFAMIAAIGFVVFPPLIIAFYNDSKNLARQASRLEAGIHVETQIGSKL